MGKRKFRETLKNNGSKRFSCSRSNLFSNTPNRQSKRMKKQNQLDDCKVKILEKHDELVILTKDLV